MFTLNSNTSYVAINRNADYYRRPRNRKIQKHRMLLLIILLSMRIRKSNHIQKHRMLLLISRAWAGGNGNLGFKNIVCCY